jgi:2-polyprenyl-3-methyl-5-hydroxy-6-metoxy-1,4-benzoquinol methylase
MLTSRSQEKEILDLGPDYYTQEEFDHCQKMLFKVNFLLGFFRTTIRTLKKLSYCNKVVDIGCGGGIFLLQLSRYFPDTDFIGVDISHDAILVAKRNLEGWKNISPEVKVSFAHDEKCGLTKSDVILATLVCHHMSDAELVVFLQQAWNATTNIVLINDLQRHWFAEFIYRWISPVLFRNRLITHDGLISIRRGFTRKEWERLLAKAKIKNYQIKWCFPFRWRVLIWKK